MTKQKLKLSDIKPKVYRLELEHPELGETGAWVDIRSARSNEYLIKVSNLERVEEGEKRPLEQAIKENAELTATLIVDWDEEFFESPFSYEKAVEILKDSSAFWIRDAVNSAQGKQSNFFTKT